PSLVELRRTWSANPPYGFATSLRDERRRLGAGVVAQAQHVEPAEVDVLPQHRLVVVRPVDADVPDAALVGLARRANQPVFRKASRHRRPRRLAKSPARKIYFHEPFQADLGCPAPGKKILLFPKIGMYAFTRPVLCHLR